MEGQDGVWGNTVAGVQPLRDLPGKEPTSGGTRPEIESVRCPMGREPEGGDWRVPSQRVANPRLVDHQHRRSRIIFAWRDG